MSPATRNPELQKKIDEMRLTIAPIVHVETGIAPPQFPHTMLNLFLLTEDELDSMAQYYSQVTPSPQTYQYPQTMDWNRSILAKPRPGEPRDCALSDYERLRIKMRMFARFIGMRGAETPMWEYERQVELLQRKVERQVEEEENCVPRKWYRGPPALP
jgi:hypothetical protein